MYLLLTADGFGEDEIEMPFSFAFAVREASKYEQL